MINLKNISEIEATIPNKKKQVITTLKNSIKEQLIELGKFDVINEIVQEEVEQVLLSASSIIDGCCTSDEFKCNRSEEFAILTYKYHTIYLKYETWKTNQKINEAMEKQKNIEDTQKKMEKQNNNIVYNILAFIASFSVVSASVTAFEKVSSVEDVLLFMAFTAFIIITTLIALDNFYRSNNEKRKILKNNYFLWGAVGVVIVILLGYKSVDYIKENQNEIFENIGRGIESIRIEYENKN